MNQYLTKYPLYSADGKKIEYQFSHVVSMVNGSPDRRHCLYIEGLLVWEHKGARTLSIVQGVYSEEAMTFDIRGEMQNKSPLKFNLLFKKDSAGQWQLNK
jgi:hypothetical protein